MPNHPGQPPAADNLANIAPIAGVSTSLTAFIGFSQSGPLLAATQVTSLAQYVSEFGALAANSEMGFAAVQFFSNGGTSLYIVRAGASGGQLNQQSAAAAFQALDAVSILNLLCLPGVIEPSILAAARSYCEKRRTFLIIDADPKANTSEKLMSLLDGAELPRSTSAAVYGPWLEIANPFSGGGLRTTAPCGAVAGVYAQTDARSGVWKAPAGLGAGLVGVLKLSAAFGDTEARALQEKGLNLLRSFPAIGIAVWGARTLVPSTDAGSGYEYVPVRRLGLFLEESIIRGTQWAVFEPNGPPLWAKLQAAVSAFLHGLFRQGAFQGSTPASAYFVKCDSSTTTQSDIDQGVLHIVVGFAPLQPAEFIALQITSFVHP